MDLFRIVESYYEISIVSNTSTSNNPDGNLKIKKGLGQYGSEDATFPSDWQVSNVQELLQIL